MSTELADFTDAAVVSQVLVVEGVAPGEVVLRPRAYRARPEWAEVELITDRADAPEPVVGGSPPDASPVAFRAALDLRGRWGTEGVILVGRTHRRRFRPDEAPTYPPSGPAGAPEPRSHSSSAATGAGGSIPVERGAGGIVVTHTARLRVGASAAVATVFEHQWAPLVDAHGPLRSAVVGVDALSGSVVIVCRWDDETSYRVAAAGALHPAIDALVAAGAEDVVTVAAPILAERVVDAGE